jgi:DNA polymerase III alpha subunit (gram-positive type)
MANDSVNSSSQEEPWQSTLQDFGRRLDEITFVVLDLETTGRPHI